MFVIDYAVYILLLCTVCKNMRYFV